MRGSRWSNCGIERAVVERNESSDGAHRLGFLWNAIYLDIGGCRMGFRSQDWEEIGDLEVDGDLEEDGDWDDSGAVENWRVERLEFEFEEYRE